VQCPLLIASLRPHSRPIERADFRIVSSIAAENGGAPLRRTALRPRASAVVSFMRLDTSRQKALENSGAVYLG